ncbi:putative RING finger protein [Aspergillus udagawae]|uniref:Putative RING finger protein n=1 Tax=Aspergillus udagawae TaxID=91492 RepID=A0A8H3RU60_9EURO|nr:putative RING finger protein [Aspergillus udagawae]
MADHSVESSSSTSSATPLGYIAPPIVVFLVLLVWALVTMRYRIHRRERETWLRRDLYFPGRTIIADTDIDKQLPLVKLSIWRTLHRGKQALGAECDAPDPSLCSICMEQLRDDEDVRPLPCEHIFHPACVDPWLTRYRTSCPLCRVSLVEHDGKSDLEDGRRARFMGMPVPPERALIGFVGRFG